MASGQRQQSLSEAPVLGIPRNLIAGYHRFDINKHPTRRERREQRPPTNFAENPVWHGEDKSVELGKMFQRNQLDVVLALSLGRVGERIGDQWRNAEFSKSSNDIWDPAVAQIWYILLKGNTDYADFRALDRPFRRDQQLNEALRDKRAHTIINAAPGEDDLRVLARGLGPGGQVIGINSDTVPADQPRGERQKIPFRTRRLEHLFGWNAEPIKDDREFIH
jgi:hypothetical protein